MEEAVHAQRNKFIAQLSARDREIQVPQALTCCYRREASIVYAWSRSHGYARPGHVLPSTQAQWPAVLTVARFALKKRNSQCPYEDLDYFPEVT